MPIPTLNPIQLIDYFPNYLTTDSLFVKMSSNGAPWTADIGKQMDIAYFTMYSGIKRASGFVRLHYTDGLVNSNLIAELLYNIFGKNWERLWDAYTTEYNPIDNYNVKEDSERDRKDDRTIDRNITDTGEVTSNGSQSDNSTVTIDNAQYGYNSTEAVPTTTSTETSESESTDSNTTKSDNTSEEKTTDGLVGKEQYTRTRTGNVGQNSYQELLTQEFELWKWNYFKHVFDDVDSYLCLLVFPSHCDHHYSQLD